MLYDQRWDAKTKADPFSLESLIAWLEKQPADGVYCYADTGHCLISQHFKAAGFGPRIAVGVGSFCTAPLRSERWSRDNNYPSAFDDIAVARPRTFGAALTRARAVLAAS